MKRLVETADVFVENYRPGAFEALGLGYEALSEINPRLIYCSMSAFGMGTARPPIGYDNILQAMSGIMAMTGTKDVAPLKCGAPVVDYATGTSGAFAIAAALFHRGRTGLGEHIDLSMLDVALILAGLPRHRPWLERRASRAARQQLPVCDSSAATSRRTRPS